MRVATATFTCDAQSSFGPDWATCNNHTTVELYNDGQYDNFNRPEGWHIKLGASPDRSIVRCPSHCRWVESNAMSHPRLGVHFGHWEDDPAPQPIKREDHP